MNISLSRSTLYTLTLPNIDPKAVRQNLPVLNEHRKSYSDAGVTIKTQPYAQTYDACQLKHLAPDWDAVPSYVR